MIITRSHFAERNLLRIYMYLEKKKKKQEGKEKKRKNEKIVLYFNEDRIKLMKHFVSDKSLSLSNLRVIVVISSIYIRTFINFNA